MTDVAEKKRQLLFGVLGLMLVIGVGGVVIALLSSSGSDDPSGGTPGANVDPLSVEGACRADLVAKYDVAASPKDKAQFTATAAAKPWLLDGESSQTTSVDDKTKLVALAKPGNEPREVLTLRQDAKGWTISSTAACLDAGAACTASTVTVGGLRYREKSLPAGTDPGVAAYVGLGTLNPCVIVDGKSYGSPRGEIAPVTAYTANEEPASAAVVIANDRDIHLFVRTK